MTEVGTERCEAIETVHYIVLLVCLLASEKNVLHQDVKVNLALVDSLERLIVI